MVQPKLKVLSQEEVIENLKRHAFPARKYAAMYSSWFGGITTDPNLMVIPIDDHGFHRGDAVFEAMKCTGGQIYTLDRHLDRMKISASKIGLEFPANMREIAIETTRASGLSDCLLRCYVSRGPGSFTPNPYESVGVQTYVVITPFAPPSAAKYEAGATAVSSKIGVKEGIFSTVKSCNYLPNVMMKKEAVDQGVDFTVSFDSSGFIAEGPTENFAILTREGVFKAPLYDRILKGITLVRAMELAVELPNLKSLIKEIRNESFTRDEVLQAQEVFFLGTTLGCMGVSSFDGIKIGSGKSGPVARALNEAIEKDILSGALSVHVAR
ncbi:MAG: peptidase [Proteobacteria bacterium]|nr:MAG: peptidase [Pseudomonadota bacterium]